MVLKLNDELKKGKSIKVYYYPCHEDKVIEESDQEKLKVSIGH